MAAAITVDDGTVGCNTVLIKSGPRHDVRKEETISASSMKCPPKKSRVGGKPIEREIRDLRTAVGKKNNILNKVERRGRKREEKENEEI